MSQTHSLLRRTLLAGLLALTLDVPAQGLLGAQNHCDWKQDLNTTGALSMPRAMASVTALGDGRVLVAGGSDFATVTARSELFDPLTGAFSAVGSLGGPRYGHAAVRLLDGRLLVAGGSWAAWSGGALTTSELFDPSTLRFSPAGAMARERVQPTLSLLQSGEVLAIGGMDAKGLPVAEIELFDPFSQSWRVVGRLKNPRMQHSATQRVLSPGMDEVVVAGGEGGLGPLASIEIYEIGGGVLTFKASASLVTARVDHGATRLLDGRILISGGTDRQRKDLASLEIIDAGGLVSSHGQLATARNGHSAVLLPTGQVLMAGGLAGGQGVAEVELFDDLGAGTTRVIGRLQEPRFGASAVELPFGQALIVGGFVGIGIQLARITELYDPFWAGVGPLEEVRALHSATLLAGSRVLLAGGLTSGGGASARGEVFETTVGRTWYSRPMTRARYGHRAVRLASGEVLIAGGQAFAGGLPTREAELFDLRLAAFRATAPMELPRSDHVMALLAGGDVLVAGGLSPQATDSSERYRFNPATGTGAFQADHGLPYPRFAQGGVVLGNGQLLAAGGADRSWSIWPTVDTYDPATSMWTAQAPLATPRSDAASLALGGMALLTGGLTWGRIPTDSFELAPGGRAGTMSVPRVGHAIVPSQRSASHAWVIGGRAGFGSQHLDSAELIDIATWTTQALPPLGVPRDRHTATLMPDGRVLVAGGRLAGLFDTATALLSKPSHCKPVQPPRWKWEWPAVTVYPWKTWPAACIPKISCK